MLKYLIPPDKKHRSYRGRYRVGDSLKVHEVTLHATVKEVAERKLKEIYEDAQREAVGLIPSSHTRKAKRGPIGEIFEEYLDSLRKNQRTAEHVRIVRLRFLALAKACSWSCLADVNLRSFIDWRNAQTGYETRTLNNYFESARGFFNWVDRNYEIPNALKRVEMLEVPIKYPQGPRAFTEDELLKLFAVAKPKRRFFYRVMTFSGLRRLESKRLFWGDVKLDGQPGLSLRPEATKARRADWLPILSVLVPEFLAARPAYWKPSLPVFPRGVPDVDTLHRDMAKAGIPLIDELGRPAGIHTFRRTFISLLQKAGVPQRVIMQLARHKSLELTNWTYTDTTMLPLLDNVEKLAALARSPRSSPLFSGQTEVSVSKAVQAEKTVEKISITEVVDKKDVCHSFDHSVQTCPNSDLVPGVGVEPTRL